jgi:hypothetical protein
MRCKTLDIASVKVLSSLDKVGIPLFQLASFDVLSRLLLPIVCDKLLVTILDNAMSRPKAELYLLSGSILEVEENCGLASNAQPITPLDRGHDRR